MIRDDLHHDRHQRSSIEGMFEATNLKQDAP